MSNSGFKITGVTQPEITSDAHEVRTGQAPAGSGSMTIISTVANIQATSLPVGPPDQRILTGAASRGFVFRIGAGTEVVAVKLDTRQIQERERVRRINESLRQSTRS